MDDSLVADNAGLIQHLAKLETVEHVDHARGLRLASRDVYKRQLIAPAHEAAKAIVDEARRAQALLDIIKEIDFLSHPQQ